MSEVAVARSGTSPGSEERFDAFVAARGDALWRSAWLLTGDRHLAEDLVQTALAKAWPKWPGIADEGRFEAYLRRTLFTTYVAWWRRKWNGERSTEHPPERSARDTDPDRSHDLMVALASRSPPPPGCSAPAAGLTDLATVTVALSQSVT